MTHSFNNSRSIFGYRVFAMWTLVALLSVAHCQYATIWSDSFETRGDWMCGNGATWNEEWSSACYIPSMESHCPSTGQAPCACVCATDGTTSNKWIERWSNIASYSALHLEFQLYVYDMEDTNDRCQIWYSYDGRERIRAYDERSDGLYSNQIVQLGLSTGEADNIVIYLEANGDSIGCSDACYFDDVILKGIPNTANVGNDVMQFAIKTLSRPDAGTIDTMIVTLWFNSTIYQVSTQPNKIDAWFTFPYFTIIGRNCRNITQTQIMFELNSADAVAVNYSKIVTQSGVWYGIDSVYNHRDNVSREWLCVDNEPYTSSSGCGPSKQIIYLDTTRPNVYIEDAMWSDGSNVDPQSNTYQCDTTRLTPHYGTHGGVFHSVLNQGRVSAITDWGFTHVTKCLKIRGWESDLQIPNTVYGTSPQHSPCSPFILSADDYITGYRVWLNSNGVTGLKFLTRNGLTLPCIGLNDSNTIHVSHSNSYDYGPFNFSYLTGWNVWSGAYIDGIQFQFTDMPPFTASPTHISSVSPSEIPTRTPIRNTTSLATDNTHHPSKTPTKVPTYKPSANPTYEASFNPTYEPSFSPTYETSLNPTYEPSFNPTDNATVYPSSHPIYNITPSDMVETEFPARDQQNTTQMVYSPRLDDTSATYMVYIIASIVVCTIINCVGIVIFCRRIRSARQNASIINVVKVMSVSVEDVDNANQDTVLRWLTDIVELPQYYNNFKAIGYDMRAVESIDDRTSLITIGIENEEHQIRILNQIRSLKSGNIQNEERAHQLQMAGGDHNGITLSTPGCINAALVMSGSAKMTAKGAHEMQNIEMAADSESDAIDVDLGQKMDFKLKDPKTTEGVNGGLVMGGSVKMTKMQNKEIAKAGFEIEGAEKGDELPYTHEGNETENNMNLSDELSS